MKVDVIQQGESDDSWAVRVEGVVIEDLTGLTRPVVDYHAALIRASGGVVELPDRKGEPEPYTEGRPYDPRD